MILPVEGEAREAREALKQENQEIMETARPVNGSAILFPSPVAESLRKTAPGILKTPIVDPVESATPPPPAVLTVGQQEKYDALLNTVMKWKTIDASAEKTGPITDNEIMWLSKECLLRYLRATKWNTEEAAKRLLSTLKWRREYGMDDLTADHLSAENETGKQLILGYDINGRPCQYLNPGLQNTEPGPKQVQHLVYMVERSIDLMGPSQETLALLINFKSSKTRSNTSPGIGQGREVLNILQTHYPERLGRALIINIPWVVWGFFKLITPFIDPLTKDKLKFNDDMRQLVPPQQLWKNFQGDLDFEYDHETYWPSLAKLCEERYTERKERWVKGGKNYGESEVYMSGGNAPAVGQTIVQGIVKDKENEPAVASVDVSVDAPVDTPVDTPVAADATEITEVKDIE